MTTSKKAGKGRGGPGVVLTVSRNPVLGGFLALYPIMILGMGAYLVVTWRPKTDNGDIEKNR